jgi:hypothetical protein
VVLDGDGGGDRLPAGQRELIVRHHLDGESLEALAESLGCDAGVIAQRLYRARRSLRGDLERHGLTAAELFEAIRAFTRDRPEPAPGRETSEREREERQTRTRIEKITRYAKGAGDVESTKA